MRCASSSFGGTRIDETLHVRADKLLIGEQQVELLGKGGRIRKIQVLHGPILRELDLSRCFVYLDEEQGVRWKDGLECHVRSGCDRLGIRPHGAPGFRTTAACEFFQP